MSAGLLLCGSAINSKGKVHAWPMLAFEPDYSYVYVGLITTTTRVHICNSVLVGKNEPVSRKGKVYMDAINVYVTSQLE